MLLHIYVAACLVQMQHGRRTASLKASYEAVSKSVELTKELALGREYGTVSSRSAQASSMSDNVSTTKTSSSRNKKFVFSTATRTYAHALRPSIGSGLYKWLVCLLNFLSHYLQSHISH